MTLELCTPVHARACSACHAWAHVRMWALLRLLALSHCAAVASHLKLSKRGPRRQTAQERRGQFNNRTMPAGRGRRLRWRLGAWLAFFAVFFAVFAFSR